MKVKIDPKRNLKIFLIAFLVCGAILFLCCIKLFVFTWPWTAVQYVIIGIYLLASIALFIGSLNTNFYIVKDDNFEVHRFGKVVVYSYKNVIYIDEKESEKSKTISFMTKFDKNPRYLCFDKDNILYNKMLEKCNNRLSEEDFKKKYPHISF